MLPNPEFTISYSGFAGSEGAGVLDPEPVATCSADESSAAGNYDITASGGAAANYNLVYVNGTLTITPDVTDPELTVQNITVQLDDQGNATITPADVVTSATDNCGVSDTTLSKSAFTEADKGDVTIDVTVSDEAGNTATKQAVITVMGSSGIIDLEESGVSFFPNPVQDLLTIETGKFSQLQVKVTSLNGEVLISTSLNGENSSQMDLSSLQKGIYFITFSSGETMTIRKIVKL